MKTIIIAEVGVNHNGNYDLACKLANEAKKVGADIVKYQTFIPEELVSKNATKADYQIKNTHNNDSQLEMLKEVSLTFEEYKKLKIYCDSIGIEFMSTAFDIKSVDFLHSIDMKLWKIPSGEITNMPLLIKVASYHQPVILSTGMCTLDEINDAINVLRDNGSGEISILHCTTEYPAPYDEINLNVIKTMANCFNNNIGYSDHSKGIEVPIAAVAIGATIIEKHFTLDKNMKGPDHKASLEPKEFKQMVRSIRNIELAKGDGIKRVTISERKNIYVARKSIVAKERIKKGDVLSEDNITTKRPGNGISPMKWFDVVGTKAIRDFEEDELIEI